LAVVDREGRLQEAAFTEGQLFLNVFEGGYPAYHQDFLARARRLRNALADPRVRPAQVEPWFNWLRERRVAEFFYVPDAEGRTIFSNIDEPRAATRDAFRILSRFALREFLPHRLPPGSERQVSALDLLAEQCILSEDLGWGTLLMNPGQSTPLVMGRTGADLYWDTYPELSTGPASIMIISNRHWEMGRYLQERFRSPGGQMQVAALNIFSHDFIDPVPDDDREALTDLGSVCEKSGRTEQRRLALQNGPTWAVAQVDALSGRFALMALLDARRRLWPLTALRAGLVLGVVVSVLVAALVGRLLAGLFLGPIRDLAAGIEQIRQRRTEVRIPVRRADEFGALAQTFNRMIADLKELELARIVQAALLPARLPQIPGYSVAVINQTATRLGGDYWDLLALPGGRWLLLVGDVTGHGVPAALAMAMAKAGITFQALGQKTTATDFLEALNHVFHSELRTMRRFMTMLVAVFEPAAHRLHLENAGQNFPVLVRNGAVAAELLEMTGFPLGVRARLTTTRCTVDMAVGDTLFFYTDGIPEVGVEGDDQLGYERMLAIMTQACQGGRPAATVLADVLAAVERAKRPGPFPDDVTLIVLRRDP
jgi:serine phosphatase RsbU (regulator of sigma subunit)